MEHRDETVTSGSGVDRRSFVKTLGVCSAAVGGAVLGRPLFAQAAAEAKPETNIDDFLKTPRGPRALPGPFPGKVVQVVNNACLKDGKFDGAAIDASFRRGLKELTGKDPAGAFKLLIDKKDVVGIKVNPVGPLINTRLEVVDAIIRWLEEGGVPRKRIVVWDRFDYMLKDAGFTAARFHGVAIEGLQTMDEEGNKWRGPDGRHLSEKNFDQDAYYFAKGILGKGVAGYKDDEFYLNQHVFNGEKSFFGKLVTKKLTRIINVPVFKNTGNGVSMATKNLGYGAICNTGRLHKPLFFNVCTEVLAAPWIREKLALNVMDGLRGQYDGGPMPNEAFVYPLQSLYFATDPFAMDMIGHQQMLAKRKAERVKVSEGPRYTDYLRYAETLKLGVADPAKIDFKRVEL